jgi:periplasmic protein TonB
MNTSRYGWPVIIAASLHGALFLISSEPVVTVDPPTKVIPIDLTRIPEEERLRMPPEDPAHSDTPAGGPVTALPELPDVVQPLQDTPIFAVPVAAERPKINPVQAMDKIPGLPAGPGGPGGPGHWGSPPIPDVGKLDRRPRAMVQPAPAYPDDMRRASLDGSVTVEFVVDTEGRVIRAEAVKWSQREFVDPAVRAVLRWRFEPGTQNGRKVSFRMAVPIEFNAAE